MSVLPTVLHCITIEHVIDDPDAIEGYLASDPDAAERCIPIVVKRMFGPYARTYGLSENLSTDMLWRVLRTFWSPWDDGKKLSVAAHFGATYIMPYLIEQVGMKYLEHGDHLEDLIRAAIEYGHFDTFQFLSKLYIDVFGLAAYYRQLEVNLADDAQYGRIDMLRYDLQILHDAGIVLPERELTYLLEISAPQYYESRENAQQEITDLLLGMGAHLSQSPMTLAARYGNIGFLRSAIKHQPEIIRGPLGSELLIAASSNNQTEIAKLLISAGVNIHFNNEEALRDAAEMGNVVIVNMLLSKGIRRKPADVHAGNDAALWIAVNRGRADIVKILLEHGANPLAIINRLPYSFGAEHYLESIELLIQAVSRLPRKKLKDTNAMAVLEKALLSAKRNRAERS